MDPETGLNIRKKLKEQYVSCNVQKPLSIYRYDQGNILEYKLEGISPQVKVFAKLEIEKFVGGGFAGQVYKTKLIELETDPEPKTKAKSKLKPSRKGKK